MAFLHQERETFVLLLVETEIVLSMGSAGDSASALVQTHHLPEDFRDKLNNGNDINDRKSRVAPVPDELSGLNSVTE